MPLLTALWSAVGALAPATEQRTDRNISVDRGPIACSRYSSAAARFRRGLHRTPDAASDSRRMHTADA